jgi:hypothetical protein
MSALPPLPLKELSLLENREVWAALTQSHRHLAEFKGLCESLPNQGILLDTLGMQEAKDSSEIENIITTHDELYAGNSDAAASPAAKEVQHYLAALRVGYKEVGRSGLIRLETILHVQAELEQNRAGLRKLPGTVLKNEATGQVIYEPPQDAVEVAALMGNLVDFLHAEARAMLKDAGAEVDEASERVRFPRELIESVIGLAPPLFRLHLHPRPPVTPARWTWTATCLFWAQVLAVIRQRSALRTSASKSFWSSATPAWAGCA